MNTIAEIKSSLHQYIAQTDDMKVLSRVEKYVRSLLDKEDEIVAYTAHGKPLTREAYKREIDRAIAEADHGEVISQEEMEKELWSGES